jgi:asparagine synthase (glutamine-hydrolysing)
MCGIAGYAGAERPRSVDAVRAMTAALSRRGPDSEGHADWSEAALGHRRLAIIDLSDAGRQPMMSEDGGIGLVFNGCIYNFRELRKELQERGHRFRSNSDTEVLLRGYQEWGIDSLVARLHGMFAFGIWDNSRRTLTLVRDRLGVKPLAYCSRNGEIAFASTVSALRAGGFDGEIDPQAVLSFLEFGFITDDRCIYSGFEKLPPASIAEWSNGRVTTRRYWTLPEPDESSRISFEEAVEETERLLVESVRLRLVADVPEGALLSGGIDSGLVCWAMCRLNANVRAFTVRAAGDPSDESADAAKTAASLGMAHEIVDMPPTDFTLDELLDSYSEPFSCESAQALLWVSRSIKRLATVVLTGDGGDDVFLGYEFFRNAWMAERLARILPRAAVPVWGALRGAVPNLGPARRMRNFLDYATGGLGTHARAHDGLPYYREHGIPGERLAGREPEERQIAASFDSARKLLGDVFSHHLRLHFTSEFMPKVDGATMYWALEARAPFLDQKLWEFGARLPMGLRLRRGRLKAVLREIARRRLGPGVAFRKKRGFTVPMESWLAERWSGMLHRLQEETRLEREGWVRRGSLDAPLRHALENRWVPPQLWRLLVLEHWLAGRHGSALAKGIGR